MKRSVTSLVFAVVTLVSTSAYAQTVTDPSAYSFKWSQPAGTAPDRFELSYDGGAFTSIGLPTQTAGVYSHPLLATIADGSHTARLRACSAAAQPQCSADVALTFTVDRPDPAPGVPTNFRLELTVQSGQVASVKIVPLPE